MAHHKKSGLSADAAEGLNQKKTASTSRRGRKMNDVKKYVVILELEGGYMDCVAICNTAEEAYGEAYLALCVDEEESENYYITLPEYREGENGMIIKKINKKTEKVDEYVTVLFYRGEGKDDSPN